MLCRAGEKPLSGSLLHTVYIPAGIKYVPMCGRDCRHDTCPWHVAGVAVMGAQGQLLIAAVAELCRNRSVWTAVPLCPTERVSVHVSEDT